MSDKKISELTASATPLAGTEVLPIVQSGVTKKVSVDNLTAGKTVNAANLVVTDDAAIGTVISTGTKLRLRTPQTGTAISADNSVNSGFVVKFAPNVTNIGNDFSQPLGFLVSDIQQAKLEATGNFTLNLGNLVIGTSGKGIDFSADGSAAGMTSELLDDYEEGTWTPTFGRGSSDPTVTYTNQVGVYTKIGRQVIAVFDITASSISGGSGDAIIKGLPFPKGNLPSATFQYRAADAVPAGSAGQVLGSYSNSGDTILYLQYENTGTAGYGTAGPVTSWNASGRINGWITYFV